MWVDNDFFSGGVGRTLFYSQDELFEVGSVAKL